MGLEAEGYNGDLWVDEQASQNHGLESPNAWKRRAGLHAGLCALLRANGWAQDDSLCPLVLSHRVWEDCKAVPPVRPTNLYAHESQTQTARNSPAPSATYIHRDKRHTERTYGLQRAGGDPQQGNSDTRVN